MKKSILKLFYAINHEAITSWVMVNGTMEIRFNDGSVLQWKSKGCVFVTNNEVSVGTPKFPECLLMAGKTKPAADGKSRCQCCGKVTPLEELIAAHCWPCLLQTEPVPQVLKMTAGLGYHRREVEQRTKKALVTMAPANLEAMRSDKFITELITDVVLGKQHQTN